MPAAVSSFPVGGKPKPGYAPRKTALCLTLVTTAAPSAICSSMVELVIGKASRPSATEH
jgi:hypothetical protein